MKKRHNKKRNTAVVYEALVKEATAAILRKDAVTKKNVVSLIQRHFKPDSTLRRDLQCYYSIVESFGCSEVDSRRIINEVKIQKRLIDPDALFKAQTELINDINKEIDSNIFNNFVPNYKTLATIDQMFSFKTSPKEKIMLENNLSDLMAQENVESKSEDIDSITVNKFIEKFNDKYSEELLQEQKELLNHYILSFADNAISLKMFINNELTRLKEALKSSKDIEEFKEDNSMIDKAEKISEKLDSFSHSSVDDEVLLTVLKTQKLVKEMYTDGDNS